MRTSTRTHRPRHGRVPGMGPVRALARAGLVALLLLGTACAGARGPVPEPDRSALDSELRSAQQLYESGNFSLAARRFESVARGADRIGDRELRIRATAAACWSWIADRDRDAVVRCTERLSVYEARQKRPDPRISTLLAMGAIAADQPLPRRALPNSVRPVLETASEAKR